MYSTCAFLLSFQLSSEADSTERRRTTSRHLPCNKIIGATAQKARVFYHMKNQRWHRHLAIFKDKLTANSYCSCTLLFLICCYMICICCSVMYFPDFPNLVAGQIWISRPHINTDISIAATTMFHLSEPLTVTFCAEDSFCTHSFLLCKCRVI